MADKFVNFVSKVLKGNRYAQVAAENNDSEWREDIEFRQKSSSESLSESGDRNIPSASSKNNIFTDISISATQNSRHCSEKYCSTPINQHEENIKRPTSPGVCQPTTKTQVTSASHGLKNNINSTLTSCHNSQSQNSQRSDLLDYNASFSRQNSIKEDQSNETADCLSRQESEDSGCEVKFSFKQENVRVEENKSDGVDKSGVQLTDLIPSAISAILQDHGIKDKIRDIKATVRNKFQPEDASGDSTEGNNFLNPMKLPNFMNTSDQSVKMDTLERSKDNTVQTYYPRTG